MINTNAFDYINVLNTAADASWMRQQVISNNIANATTPGYVREDVAFESELQKALGNCSFESMDHKVSALRGKSVSPVAYKDYTGYSYRLDGNNVDPDSENVMLAENQIKYQGLMKGISQEFENLKMVMK